MSIATLDGVLAGFQTARPFAKMLSAALISGRPQSLWVLTGNPGVGVQDTTLNGAVLSSSVAQVAGQFIHQNPPAGNAYLGRFEAQAGNPGTLLLCDRLWSNGGYNITSTSAQNSTTPAWPARDVAGSANGDGVLLGLEVSATVGAGTPTITIDYTNQAGTASRAGVNIDATSGSATTGAFYRISLQAGDTGVRSVQSLTLNATWTSGTINLVAYRLLAALELNVSNVSNAIDAITGAMPRLYDGSVPFLVLIPQSTSTTNVCGVYAETQG